MPFWMLVLMIVTLILLCWGSGWGVYRGVPQYGYVGGILGLLGLVWLVILVIVFIGGAGPIVAR